MGYTKCYELLNSGISTGVISDPANAIQSLAIHFHHLIFLQNYFLFQCFRLSDK